MLRDGKTPMTGVPVFTHIDEDLAEWNMGTLPSERQAEVAQHLAQCEQCRAQAQELQMALDALAPGPFETRQMWQGMTAHLVDGKQFAHFTAQLTALFDLPAEKVSALLEQMSRAEGWFEGPAPGVEVFPVNAGPKVGDALTAFLKIAPGAQFPHHEHNGSERVLVLQGGYLCSSGIEVWRGEVDVREAGTSHSFIAVEGVPCIAAAVTYPSEN